ncbi:hypothetical protein L7F22_060432 [Adiantum nelumboides]|nr:hypothetical protein [Adiantum nelumboides]
MYVGCGNAAFCKLPAALSSPMDMYIINGFQRPPKKTMAKEVSSQALPSSPFPLLPSSHRHRLFTLPSSPLLLSLLPLSSSTHPLLSKTSLSPHLQARVSSITYPLLFLFRPPPTTSSSSSLPDRVAQLSSCHGGLDRLGLASPSILQRIRRLLLRVRINRGFPGQRKALGKAWLHLCRY